MLKQLLTSAVVLAYILLSTSGEDKEQISSLFIKVKSIDDMKIVQERGHESASTQEMIPLAVSSQLGLKMIKYGVKEKPTKVVHKNNFICNVMLFSVIGAVYGVVLPQQDSAYLQVGSGLKWAVVGAAAGGGYYVFSRAALGGLDFLTAVIRFPGDAFGWIYKIRKSLCQRSKKP